MADHSDCVGLAYWGFLCTLVPVPQSILSLYRGMHNSYGPTGERNQTPSQVCPEPGSPGGPVLKCSLNYYTNRTIFPWIN